MTRNLPRFGCRLVARRLLRKILRRVGAMRNVRFHRLAFASSARLRGDVAGASQPDCIGRFWLCDGDRRSRACRPRSILGHHHGHRRTTELLRSARAVAGDHLHPRIRHRSLHSGGNDVLILRLVPEPSRAMRLGLGLGNLLLRRRREWVSDASPNWLPARDRARPFSGTNEVDL